MTGYTSGTIRFEMSDVNKIYLDEELAVEYYLMGLNNFPKGGMGAFELTYTDLKYKNDFVRGILQRKLQVFGAESTKNNECLLFVGNFPNKEWARMIAAIAVETNIKKIEACVIPNKK